MLFENALTTVRIPIIDEARSLNLSNSVAIRMFEVLDISDGEILQIHKNGIIERSVFALRDSFRLGMNMYRADSIIYNEEADEIDEIKSYASAHGYTSEEVDYLLSCGCTVDDLLWGL